MSTLDGAWRWGRVGWVLLLALTTTACGTVSDTWHWARLQQPAWSGQVACMPDIDLEPGASDALCASLGVSELVSSSKGVAQGGAALIENHSQRENVFKLSLSC